MTIDMRIDTIEQECCHMHKSLGILNILTNIAEQETLQHQDNNHAKSSYISF